MEIQARIDQLFAKDTKAAYANLRELEALSDRESVLYPHMDTLLSMLHSDAYVIRVRGLRLLCKQAKWDRDNIIDRHLDAILSAVDDEKPTAVRQALQYLGFVVPYKKALNGRIKEKALSLDCSRFKDTMRPLIQKDIRHLVTLISRQSV